MNPADIVGGKWMIAVISLHQLRHRAELFLQLDTVHLTFLGDATEIPQNPAARRRLVLPFNKTGRLVSTSLFDRTFQ